jgi:hypothetical protein
MISPSPVTGGIVKEKPEQLEIMDILRMPEPEFVPSIRGCLAARQHRQKTMPKRQMQSIQ